MISVVVDCVCGVEVEVWLVVCIVEECVNVVCGWVDLLCCVVVVECEVWVWV